jgi:hypothetical protein
VKSNFKAKRETVAEELEVGNVSSTFSESTSYKGRQKDRKVPRGTVWSWEIIFGIKVIETGKAPTKGE